MAGFTVSIPPVFRLLYGTLDKLDRRRAGWLAAGMLVGAGVEVLGIGAVLPFVSLVMDPGMLEGPGYLAAFYRWSGVQSINRFIVLLGLLLIGIFVVKNAYLAMLTYYQGSFVYDQDRKLGDRLLAGYVRAPYALHLQRNSSDLLRMVTTEVGSVVNGVLMPSIVLLTEAAVLLVLLLLLFFAEPQLTMAALTLLALGGYVAQRLFRPMIMAYRELRVTRSKERYKWVSQILGGVKELLVLGREQPYLDIYRRCTTDLVRSTKVFNVLNAMPRLMIETTVVAVVIAVMVLVLLRGETASAVIPLLTVFALAAIRMTPSVTRIVACINSIRFYSPALAAVAKDFRDYAVHQPFSGSAASAGPVPRLAPVEFAGASYRHAGGSDWILRDITLRIESGESLAITGRSGAGKSTLVDILFGLLLPQRGSVRMNGVPLPDLPPSWRVGVGYVPQSIFLLDDTVRRNVAFGFEDERIDDQRLWRALALAQIDGYVAKLSDGLDTVVGERGVRLSGGERQRIGIARALYGDPQLIVFDEATSALDNQTEQQIADTMLSLAGLRTIIVIAHRLTTIRQCKRVIFLDEGCIADEGTFDELYQRCPAFHAMTRTESLVARVASAG